MAQGRFLSSTVAEDIRLNSLSLEAHLLYLMAMRHHRCRGAAPGPGVHRRGHQRGVPARRDATAHGRGRAGGTGHLMVDTMRHLRDNRGVRNVQALAGRNTKGKKRLCDLARFGNPSLVGNC